MRKCPAEHSLEEVAERSTLYCYGRSVSSKPFCGNLIEENGESQAAESLSMVCLFQEIVRTSWRFRK